MYTESTQNGITLIPLAHGRALVASQSNRGRWYVVSLSRCQCPGFAYRGQCRHIAALADFLNVEAPAERHPVDDGETLPYAEWLERRQAVRS